MINSAERFDQLAKEIEKRVANIDMKPLEIATEVASTIGVHVRSFADYFQILTSESLNAYITGRRLNAAYQFLVNSNLLNISDAVGISGYADQPAFSKAFKKKYDMTPKQAFERKDISLIEPPLSWEMLSNTTRGQERQDMIEEPTCEKMIFGVSQSTLETVSEVLDLEAFYGLPRKLSEFAFNFSQSSERELKDCFAFVASIYAWCGLISDSDLEFDSSDEDENPLFVQLQNRSEEMLYSALNNETIQKAYFESGLNADYAADLVEYYGASWEQLQQCDNVMLRAFPGFEDSLGFYLPTNNKKQLQWRFARFLRCYEFYTQYYPLDIDETDEDSSDERFIEFMDLVSSGMSLESAFDELEFQRTLEEGTLEDFEDLLY